MYTISNSLSAYKSPMHIFTVNKIYFLTSDFCVFGKVMKKKLNTVIKNGNKPLVWLFLFLVVFFSFRVRLYFDYDNG